MFSPRRFHSLQGRKTVRLANGLDAPGFMRQGLVLGIRAEGDDVSTNHGGAQREIKGELGQKIIRFSGSRLGDSECCVRGDWTGT